jgi:uncharacterized membrane protein
VSTFRRSGAKSVMTKGRVEALSDGVFAVAMTILIFNVEQPNVEPGGLAQALLREWPSYAAYAGSFLTVGVLWMNHHAVFERLVAMNRALMLINLLLLMTIVFVPFPTALLGKHIGTPSDASTAATVYALTFLLVSIFFSMLWSYALTQPHHLWPGFDREAARRQLPRFLIGLIIYLICIPIAQFSPTAVVVLVAVSALYYMFESLPEVPGRTIQSVLAPKEQAEREAEVIP